MGARAVKAVIPAAGMATRFLPATMAVPKELFPLIDRPVLQYVVEEAVDAGISDIFLVTGRGKDAMMDHFDRRPDVEQRLLGTGDLSRLDRVRRVSGLADLHFCRQSEPLGNGHAVGVAAVHVGDNPFVVLNADEFVDPADPLLPSMLDLQHRTGGIVLALMEVEPHESVRYGMVATAPVPWGVDVVEVTAMVEKPSPADSPGTLAMLGRFVLPGSAFAAIAKTAPGVGGEIQLTDAMVAMLDAGTPVHGIVYHGRRYDTGIPLAYLQTAVRLAGDHPDLGADLRRWLVEYLDEKPTEPEAAS